MIQKQQIWFRALAMGLWIFLHYKFHIIIGNLIKKYTPSCFWGILVVLTAFWWRSPVLKQIYRLWTVSAQVNNNYDKLLNRETLCIYQNIRYYFLFISVTLSNQSSEDCPHKGPVIWKTSSCHDIMNIMIGHQMLALGLLCMTSLSHFLFLLLLEKYVICEICGLRHPSRKSIDIYHTYF